MQFMFVILSRQYNQSIMRFCGNDRRVRFVAQSSKYPGMFSTVRLAALFHKDRQPGAPAQRFNADRKSTRLNSSHAR